MKKMKKRTKRILLLHIILAILFAVAIIFVVWPKLKSQTTPTPSQETNCIKNKDQAIKILLGSDEDVVDRPTLTYKRTVEAKGGEFFFEDGYWSDDVYRDIDIGEKLKNGSKLLQARYSYRVDLCDIDLEKKDISLQVRDKKYQFSFVNNDGVKDQFVDETKSCDYNDPSTQLIDLDGDGQKEIIVNCSRGGVSSGEDLYIYKLKDNRLSQIGYLDSEGKYDVKDCNGDSIQDIVTYVRNVPFGNSGLASWKNSIYCNNWDKSKNEFVETKIGEE